VDYKRGKLNEAADQPYATGNDSYSVDDVETP